MITAKLLNEITTTVNNSAQNRPSPANYPRTFGEIARTHSTVTATDSGGDTVEFEQIDSITLRDGIGDIIILMFNNL